MTEYGTINNIKPSPNATHPLLSHDPVKEKKEVRKKLLEQVEQRRKQNYMRWLKKSRLQVIGDLI